jgi:hypothetical protein
MPYYKAVFDHHGQLFSMTVEDPVLETTYYVDTWVKAQVEGTPLIVSNSLETLKTMYRTSANVKIYECEVKNPRYAFIIPDINEISSEKPDELRRYWNHIDMLNEYASGSTTALL